MKKADMIKSIVQKVSESTSRKKYGPLHARGTISEFLGQMQHDLQEHGKFSYPGFGSFRVNLRNGDIEFKPAKTFHCTSGDTLD